VTDRVRTQPCEACPYRRDVPSGIWSAEDYDKLPPYDAPTHEQPVETFACHATPEFYCHGWAVVHSNRGHQHELLSLRLCRVDDIPEPAVPLFTSGTEAAEHGKRDIKRPKQAARRAVARLQSRYSRLK
jgi:hypothetical protein